MTDGDALLAAILAAPEEDTPRLMYADWLEENGEGGKERGGFIRFQLDYAFHARLDDTGDRFVEWEDDADVWPYRSWPDSAETLFGGNDPKMRGVSFRWRRGFLDRVECPAAEWFGAPCGSCRQRERDPRGGLYTWTCTVCRGTGRVGGYGPAVVRRHPVTRVVATDMPVFPSGGNDTFYVGGLGRLPQEYWSRLDSLPSRQAAEDARSACLIAWAKSQPA